MSENFQVSMNTKESINTQPWFKVLCSGGEQLLLKTCFTIKEALNYSVMCFFNGVVWEEVKNGNDFLKKCKDLNPNIEAPLEKFLSYLDNCYNNFVASSSQFKILLQNDLLELSFKSKLQVGVPFNWTFLMNKSSSEKTSNQVIMPLFIMVSELSRRQQELVELLLKKDREIQEYKLQGCQVSRKHLETVPFDEASFNKIWNGDISKQCYPFSIFDTPYLKELYSNVMINKSFTESYLVKETVETKASNDQIPDCSGSSNSLHSLAVDKENDIEKERREALKKRLQDEVDRKGKKKRKIKI